ncbi:arrestin domain-containing protein 3-like [Gouania willdenowi]|uniref:arrestin domain-containing protein 3-like n=1 Tax=Gouania willdenowi TaxID=441366 RepID=UPI00105414C2|nr:arrestin domain-containing protein 3-like [Gouania willdenowi]
MAPINDFEVLYEAPNKEGTFSEGDTITGTVSFNLSKETKVKSVTVKAMGETSVHWTKGTGDRKKRVSAYRPYFKVKDNLVAKSEQETRLPKGPHNFKFKLQIPNGDWPSSFHGIHGRIFYALVAKITRGWHLPSSVQKEINFQTKIFPFPSQISSGSVSKVTGTFSKGEIQMHASLDRQVCSPGDTLTAVAKIRNGSSKPVKPKFALEQKTLYQVRVNRNFCYKTHFKMVGDPIAPNSEGTATCQVQVPTDVGHSFQNCDVVSVEYYLKAYVDVKFALDPEVQLPLVIVPSTAINTKCNEPYTPAGPSDSDFPPSNLPAGAYGFMNPGPPQYYAPGLVPYASPANSYYNQWPQGVPSYGTPMTTQIQAPPGPPPFQQEDDPPSYPSLFSPPL